MEDEDTECREWSRGSEEERRGGPGDGLNWGGGGGGVESGGEGGWVGGGGGVESGGEGGWVGLS